MTPEHWQNRMSRIMGAWIGAPGRGGQPLLLLMNGRDMDASFVLPPGQWAAELDTTQADGRSTWRQADQPAGGAFVLPSRSVMLLRDASSAPPD
jgi:glycogen operon protein